jgi:hypothetical protein
LVSTVLISACGPGEPADPFGHQKLKRELGDATPDGSGVEVHLVEARQDITEVVDGVEKKIGTAFAPNPVLDEFIDKNIRFVPEFSRLYSGHANSVGGKFFGHNASMAPGIEDIEAWESMAWMDSVLNTGRRVLPTAQSARVANHSWVANAEHPELPGTRNVEILRRLDWMIETDEFIQVVGFNGSADSPLLASAWNAITVSQIDGARASGAAPVGHDDYRPGRFRPDVVVEEASPSSAAARVSSAAALLVDAGRVNGGPPQESSLGRMVNRAGVTIRTAERSEVVRAALMAGANRVSIDGNPPGAAAGLDERFGAGRLDVFDSYRIIAGGEHDSVEDTDGSKGDMPDHGFDYDGAFGGAHGSNSSATYSFVGRDESIDFTAALVWNAQVPTGRGLLFNQPARVVGLILSLYDMSATDGGELIVRSNMSPDNRQFIRHRLEAQSRYELRVEVAPAQALFAWDYALAWSATP